MKLLYIKQNDLKDCGVSCLMSIVRYYGGYVRREFLREITNTSSNGVSAYSLINSAKYLGMEANAIKGNIKDISNYLPVIAHTIQENGVGHFVVISKINNKDITVMDPSCGFLKYSYQEWSNISTNTYLIYKPKSNLIKQIKEESFFKVLFNIFKIQKRNLFLIFVLSLIYAISNILISFGFKYFIQYNNKITILFILFILILLLKEFSNLFRNLLVNYLNHILDKTLMHDVYNHIIKLPYTYFKSRKKGDIITRLQDVSKIRDVISKFMVTLLIDCLFVLIVLLVMFQINIKLTIIVLIITIIYTILIILYSRILSKKIKSIKDDEVSVNNYLIESLSSIDTIKGMQIENYLENKLIAKQNKLLSNSFSFNNIFYREAFFKEIIYGIGSLLILLIGTIYINKGIINITTLIVFYTLAIYYFNPITNICNMELLIKDAYISFIRIKELLNIDEEKYCSLNKKQVSHLKGLINIHNLIYSYNGIDEVLKCNNLEIKNGDKVLLYGVSGGGKSTFMKILAGYITNYKGDILIDKTNLYDYNLLNLRNRITYLSQDEVLYTDTIYNNIVLNKQISFEKYKEICDITGISSIYKNSILHDEMLIENNASNISGGEKQRILLARSLVKDSDIYIFDESFSAIDIDNERKILIKIFNYLKNKTIIVISHRFNNRDLYQKFILVKKGQVYEY